MEKVIIVGSGPAGLSSAIYCARAALKPLLIEGYQWGGQLMLTTMVENYPGFSGGIMGPQLMEAMRSQAKTFGTKIISEDVTRIDLLKRPFRLEVGGGQEFETEVLIFATGASARLLGLPSERSLLGRGVSTCATCDGPFFKDQEICVVGGGDSALEEATFLTRFASIVHVIHRRDKLRASVALQERAFKDEKIQFIWDSVVEEILGQESVTAIKIKNVKTGQISEKPCGGVFVAIGHVPNTSLVKGQLELDKAGYIVTKGGTKTSVPGVFAAGDVQDYAYRQAITAAGSGCMAALDAEKYLKEL